MLEKWIDPYELKARIVPGIILVFPILIDGLYSAPILSNWPVFTVSGICGFALVYGLGLLVRATGSGIQGELYASWGGAPSTRMVRHRDSFFGEKLKELIYEGVARELSSELPSAEQEGKNPERADKEIDDVFRRVRQYLRATDGQGLWSSHNAEYGFYRNLLGSRVHWLLIAIAATIFAVIYGTKNGHSPANPASVLNALLSSCAAYVGWVVLPNATRRAAEQYAESAWMAFLRKAEEAKQASLVAIQVQKGESQHGI